MLITDSNGVSELAIEFAGQRFISIDLETTGLDMIESNVIGVAFATKNGEWYIDLEELGKTTDVQQFWLWLSAMMHSNKFIWLAHNAPFDMYFVDRELKRWGEPSLYTTFPTWWDTMGMAALVDENMISTSISIPSISKAPGAISLKALSYIFLCRTPEIFPGVEEFSAWDSEHKAKYASADARNCYDLAVIFSNILKGNDLLQYFKKRIAPLSYVTMAMEISGLKLDIPKLLEIQKECNIKLDELRGIVVGIVPPTIEYKMKGRGSAKKEVEISTPFNPNSTVQLGKYLLSRGYKLPLTQTGRPSVEADTIAKLSVIHKDDPIWEPLLALRQLEKLLGTYVNGCLEFAWSDSTTHPEWNSVATLTGRMSATTATKDLVYKRGPALQTIPRPDTLEESGWLYNPREWFIADEGKCFGIVDLSQAEVRMLAVKSQDPELMKAVNAGIDVHIGIAARAYRKEWASANEEQRKKIRTKSKETTFGIGYGMGPGALAEKLHCSYEEAEELISDFYHTFSGVQDWKNQETYFLKRNGYVLTLEGRRRTPILMVDAPKITASSGTFEYNRQQNFLLLWQAEYDRECARSKFDPQNVEENERMARSIRQAINFEIQGSVAEFINDGMIKLVYAGYDLKAQVHDEIIVEIPDTDIDRENLKQFFSQIFEMEIGGVKFIADIKFGKSWAEK